MLTSEVPCRVFVEENWSWIGVDILCFHSNVEGLWKSLSLHQHDCEHQRQLTGLLGPFCGRLLDDFVVLWNKIHHDGGTLPANKMRGSHD
jgi:hypothetical protein